MKYILVTILLTYAFVANAQTDVIDHSRIKSGLLQFTQICFEAFNTCDVNKTAELLTDDFEFYHDLAGPEE
jgi:hypothetical protein